LFQFVVAVFEKQPIREYEIAKRNSEVEYGEYMKNAVFCLENYGFNILHGRTRKYNVSVAIATSKDRLILAVAGEGTIIGIRAKKTILYSELGNGKWLVTKDEVGIRDHSGLALLDEMMDASIEDLFGRHLSRIKDEDVVPLTGNTPLHDLDHMEIKKTQSMVNSGMARWRDDRHWSYTIVGAVAVVFDFFPQIAKELKKGSASN
jgi:hypothetical protein